MKKTISILLVMVLCLALFAGCAAGQESKTLNLFTWEGMFPPEVLEDFEKETGITINYSNFDFDETMLTRLQAAKGGEFDLVIADDYIIETVIAEGLAQKLDKSKISNYSNINPIYQGQFYDSSDDYTVPYGAGVMTIAYNPDDVGKEITGYEDLWDPALKDKVGIIANFRVVNGMALKINGESYNTNDLDTIRQAGDKLIELAPNIRLIKDDNMQDDLISGEISAAVMYTSQVTSAMLTDPSLKVAFPKEGIGFGIMAGFVPSQAPNANAAHKFLEYILDPEVSARCFEWLGYYCTNKAADSLIADEFKSFLTLPEGFNSDMEMIQNISPDAEDLHSQVWTEFKTATGK